MFISSHLTHTRSLEIQDVHAQSHTGIFMALTHLPASLLTHTRQLQLACVSSTAAASVPDTEPIIAL